MWENGLKKEDKWMVLCGRRATLIEEGAEENKTRLFGNATLQCLIIGDFSTLRILLQPTSFLLLKNAEIDVFWFCHYFSWLRCSAWIVTRIKSLSWLSLSWQVRLLVSFHMLCWLTGALVDASWPKPSKPRAPNWLILWQNFSSVLPTLLQIACDFVKKNTQHI